MHRHPMARQLGMGDAASDLLSAGKTAGASFLASLLSTQTAQPVVQQMQQQAVESGGAKAFAWVQQNWKTIALGAVGLTVVFGGSIYFMARRKR